MKSIVPQNATNVIIESDRRIKPKEQDELLEPLKDQRFYRHEGWWSYEFCYHGKIRQVHVEGEKRMMIEEPEIYQRMLQSLISKAQQCNNEKLLENPYLQMCGILQLSTDLGVQWSGREGISMDKAIG